MNEEDRLSFIDQCLKKFEYPNVYAVNMSEIFGVSNRKFLLSWLCSLFEGCAMKGILPDETLCEFLNWFCKSSQVKGVLRADMEYPIQLKILYRIFRNLDCIKGVKYCDKYTDLSLHDTQVFCERDMNIFKNFGPITITDDEVNISELKTTEPLKDICAKENEEICLLSPRLKPEMLIAMENSVLSATAIMSNISRYWGNEDFNIELSNNNVELFREFNKQIEKGKGYIKNVEALSHFNEELNHFDYKLPKNNEYNESMAMVREVIKLIQEIKNM